MSFMTSTNPPHFPFPSTGPGQGVYLLESGRSQTGEEIQFVAEQQWKWSEQGPGYRSLISLRSARSSFIALAKRDFMFP